MPTHYKKKINDVLIEKYLEQREKSGGKSLQEKYPEWAHMIENDQDLSEEALESLISQYRALNPTGRGRTVPQQTSYTSYGDLL